MNGVLISVLGLAYIEYFSVVIQCRSVLNISKTKFHHLYFLVYFSLLFSPNLHCNAVFPFHFLQVRQTSVDICYNFRYGLHFPVVRYIL